MDLHRLLKPLRHESICSVLNQLREAVGEVPEGRVTHRTMTADQLRQLAASPQITIGAHTVTHPQLRAHARGEQRQELAISKVVLESAIEKDVISMSYPFGGYGDFAPATQRIARRCGYQIAFANRPGLATSDRDRYAIPRVLVRDVSGKRFSEQLHQYFGTTPRERLPLEIAA
jgi:peptidoglycan/xylan/chitin deacetylase (PgdA/CDA1 family)